jgi:hypothetical protein
MPTYDATGFDPPAPVARVTVRQPADGALVSNVPLLIDTGADVSLLPAAPIHSLVVGHESESQFELEGFDGTRSFAPAVRLELHLLGKVFRGQFLVIEQDFGVLGRNVLNALSLQLDGPALIWNERR